MTKQECAVIMAYTGVIMLKGNDLGIFYEYIEHICGRPIFTHELSSKKTLNEIEEKSKSDFLRLCSQAT